MSKTNRGTVLKIAGGTILPLILLVPSWNARAEGPASAKVSWGAFVDSYYAYDFNGPANPDRSFTTQPARHNEFNVNLAFVEAKLTDDKVHGRLALQAGTSVQSNYAGEPTIGSVSGPSLSRHIQEAYAGYHLAKSLWVDGGIFFSHTGLESFISRDNMTYTRSLVSDYSPYYQTGVRFLYTPSEQWGFQLQVLNGWQNISENNSAKSVGTGVSFAPTAALSFTYNTLIGREIEFRQFHDLVIKYSITDVWQAGLQADLGFQSRPGSSAVTWYGGSVVSKYSLTKTVAVAVRGERYSDDKQVIVVTGTPNGFQTWGVSANVDVQLDPRVFWRSEVRGYWSKDAVFPTSDRTSTRDGVAVTSIAISI